MLFVMLMTRATEIWLKMIQCVVVSISSQSLLYGGPKTLQMPERYYPRSIFGDIRVLTAAGLYKIINNDVQDRFSVLALAQSSPSKRLYIGLLVDAAEQSGTLSKLYSDL